MEIFSEFKLYHTADLKVSHLINFKSVFEYMTDIFYIKEVFRVFRGKSKKYDKLKSLLAFLIKQMLTCLI